jgi:hypothetical protein
MATLRNLTVAILKLGGATNIAAATRHHARDAARLPPSTSPRHDLALAFTARHLVGEEDDCAS